MSPRVSENQVGKSGGAATLAPLSFNLGYRFPSGSGRIGCVLYLVYQLHEPRNNNVEIFFALPSSFHEAVNPEHFLLPFTPSPIYSIIGSSQRGHSSAVSFMGSGLWM